MSVKHKVIEWGTRSAVRFPRTFWLLFRLREWGRKTWHEATPGGRAWRGAALGLIAATVVVALDGLYYRALLPHPTWDRFWGSLDSLWAAGLMGVGLILLASLIGRTPWRYRLALGVCGGILASSFPFGQDNWTLAWGVLAFSAAGAGLGAITRPDPEALTPVQRRIALAGIVAGVGTVAYLSYFLFNPGYEALEYRNAANEARDDAGAAVQHIDLPDPSTPGAYEVDFLTYGSGDDIRRNEFGRDADLVTPTVDGRPFLNSWSGDSGEERKNFWGFDRDELPLQGRVWYPRGDGPFPLVLVVHGNHSMYDYSDPGYQYLGEMLASRGMILVSVDENFINGNIRQENDARGWMLLEHLAQWQRWNDGVADDDIEDAADPLDNPFYGKVDMGRIGLIGHSRGGEAVAVAAALNELPYYPDDATVPFDYNFDIGAVVAIAPVMGQYQPGGRFTDIYDVNYFVLHGANDGDVSSFNGAGQYEHVWFSGGPYRFKSSLYVMGANHGQFNQTWGSWDNGAPFGRILSTRSLIPEADQRQVAEVYISAFLEATLRDEPGYLPMFADARVAAEWLPDTAYLVEFDDSRSVRVATFDEDVDVTTTTIAGGRTSGEGLNVWREQNVAMKSRTKETAGVYLGWELESSGDDGDDDDNQAAGNDDDNNEHEGEPAAHAAEEQEGANEAGDRQRSTDEFALDEGTSTPRYVIELPADFVVAPDATLFFSLADANESSSMPDHLKPDEEHNPPDEEQAAEHGQAGGQAQHGQPPGPEQEQQQSQNQGDNDDDSNNGHEDNKNGNNEEDDDAEEEDEDAPREPIDFTVRLIDASGEAAELPLSRFSMVQPQLEVQLRKSLYDDPRTESEAVFQSFLFPLEWFVEVNPTLDSSRPARLELVFDRSAAGVVILDSVGFRPPVSSGR